MMAGKITNFFDFIINFCNCFFKNLTGRGLFFSSFMVIIALLLCFFIGVNLSIPDFLYFGEEYPFYSVIIAHSVLIVNIKNKNHRCWARFIANKRSNFFDFNGTFGGINQNCFIMEKLRGFKAMMTTKITNFFDFDGKFFSLFLNLFQFNSKNPKKIGRLGLFFDSFMAIIAIFLFFFIRINLSIPDFLYLGEEYQFYNIMATAQGVLMVNIENKSYNKIYVKSNDVKRNFSSGEKKPYIHSSFIHYLYKIHLKVFPHGSVGLPNAFWRAISAYRSYMFPGSRLTLFFFLNQKSEEVYRDGLGKLEPYFKDTKAAIGRRKVAIDRLKQLNQEGWDILNQRPDFINSSIGLLIQESIEKRKIRITQLVEMNKFDESFFNEHHLAPLDRLFAQQKRELYQDIFPNHGDEESKRDLYQGISAPWNKLAQRLALEQGVAAGTRETLNYLQSPGTNSSSHIISSGPETFPDFHDDSKFDHPHSELSRPPVSVSLENTTAPLVSDSLGNAPVSDMAAESIINSGFVLGHVIPLIFFVLYSFVRGGYMVDYWQGSLFFLIQEVNHWRSRL